jgi:NADH-quinone oxidoreductase subunit A
VETVTLGAYLPILFLTVLATLFAVVSLLVASRLSPKSWTEAKLKPYESGLVPEPGTGRERFPVKFYLVAMSFIIFDIEVAFLFPWAAAHGDMAVYGLVVMGVFLVILTAGYVYEWIAGGFEWVE